MSLTRPQLYRSVLRQFVQNSIHPRAERSKSISNQLRLLIEASAGESETEMKKLRTEVENMVVYLKSHRLHKELVERYNPTNTLTGEERAKMSGRVVGLDMPKLYDPNSVELEEGESKDGKGSLKTMFNQ